MRDAIGLGGMGWPTGRRHGRGAGGAGVAGVAVKSRPRPRTVAYAVAAMLWRTRPVDHAIGWFW